MKHKAICLIVLFCAACLIAEISGSDDNVQSPENSLHNAAKKGELNKIKTLLADGADVNQSDTQGNTPLHLAAAGGHQLSAKALLEAGANIQEKDHQGRTAIDIAGDNGHLGLCEFLMSQLLENHCPILKPTLKFKTLEQFEVEIKEPAVLLDSKYICFFAPKRKAQEANIIFDYLVSAYDELYKIVQVHTKYKIAVYAFPKGNQHGWGGTSSCSIEYDDSNLNLDKQSEWVKCRVPHVSGYIEEMSHNFVSATKVQFGWEMIGWSISTIVTERIAGNTIYQSELKSTREIQKTTFERYMNDDCVFPKDLPANVCDRIHAWILWQCELGYGPNFWRDFFKEVRLSREEFDKAERLNGEDARNARYQVTLECFGRMKGLKLKETLQNCQISLTTDVKSLHPEDPSWNRKFIP